jgi:hypothetical protein
MIRGLHADMAAHDAGEPLPPPPLEQPIRIYDIKGEIARTLDEADRPLSAGDILAAIEMRHGTVANPGSIRATVDQIFSSCRVTVRASSGRDRPRYLYSAGAAAE